jgi:peptidoglycan/LPS O-acetylase OafA/YrhL
MVAWLCLLHGRLPFWGILVSGLAVALLAAAAMHRLVEAPSRDLARWLERRLARWPHRAGATTEAPAGHGLS